MMGFYFYKRFKRAFMKNLETWLSQYGQSHTNSTNKLIHWICVPSIFFSILALFSLIEISFLSEWMPAETSNFASVFIFLALIFYIRLSIPMALGILLFTYICYQGIFLLNETNFKLQISASLFVIAWIAQFVGHKIEGAKPSFFEDLKFLLIGPAWLISFIYTKLGIKY
tara:strand:- start:1609 stop:2118 length:510 start_codon:yes stop_codon:yes gene_type:complete